MGRKSQIDNSYTVLVTSLERWLRVRGGSAQEEESQGAGEPNEQASDPDGLRGNVIVKVSADDRGEGAGDAPSQPVHGHVTAAQIGRRQVGNIFAGSRDESQLAHCQDDHAQTETPESAH